MKAKQDDPSALHVVLFQEVSSGLEQQRQQGQLDNSLAEHAL